MYARLAILAILQMGAAPGPTAIAPTYDSPKGFVCGHRIRPGVCADAGDAAPIAVEPGTHRLRVCCRAEDTVLAPPPIDVTVKAGETARPAIAVRTAKMRVEARRSGVLSAAHVDLYPVGAGFEGAALVRVPANRTVVVASGRYDVLVTLADDQAPRAEVAFERVTLSAKKKILRADLSDGGLIVSVERDGRAADAAVRAFVPGKKRDVGLVSAKEELRLPAGRYRIETELGSSFDYATNRRAIWIEAGKTTRLKERFDTGTLAVKVTADGTAVPAIVRLSRPGAADYFNYFEAPGPVTLSPGVYDLTIAADAAGPLGPQRIEGVRVTKKRRTERALDLTRATLTVRIVKNGNPVGFAEVDVHAAGGGSSVAPETDGAFRLWPGRYEIVARLESGAELTDGPFSVSLGQRVTKTLAFDRAFITVRARRGPTDVDAKVFVYKHGATKPIAQGLARERIEVFPGVYDVKVVAGADAQWQQRLALEDSLVVTVDLPEHAEEALPAGDLPEGDLPEGDADG